MDQGEFESLVLVLLMADLAMAGIVLACVMLEGRRIYIFAATAGAITALLSYPLLENIRGGILFFTLFGALLGGGFAGMIRAFLSWSALKGLAEEIRSAVDIRRWLPEAEMPKLTPRDRVRRVFVAVSAATGAVVFSMFWLDSFREAFWQEMTPLNFIGVGVAFVAGMFLVGPAQAYVFERGEADGPDPGKELSWALQSGFDARAAMRLAIVLAMGLQFGLLMNCVNASVRTGDAQVLYTILNSALPPAIVSYFMSAALQLRTPVAIPKARKASLYGGAILHYGIALIVVFNIVLNLTSGLYAPGSTSTGGAQLAFVTLIATPVLAIGVALVFSVLTTYLPAVAVAYAIQRRSGASAMAHVGAALIAVAILQALGLIGLIALQGVPLENIRIGTFAGAAIGWIVGLWASGFPKLLTQGRAATQPAAA